MDRIARNQRPGAFDEVVGVAIGIAQPLFEHLVNRRPFPRRAMIGVDRLETAQAQHRLGIKSEGVGLQAINLGHRNLAWPLGLGRRWPRPAHRPSNAGIIESYSEPFEPASKSMVISLAP